MRQLSSILFAAFLLTLLAACGGTSTTTGSSSSPTQPPAVTSLPTATPTPQAAHAGKSADQIVKELQAHGLPVGAITVYTDKNDPNNLLGRPGQYISKASFKDTRIGNVVDFGVSTGGSVEVFASTTDAQYRFTYLQALSTSGNPLFAEYEYLDGVAILRVSSQLTPGEAKAYETAFKAVS